MSDHANKTVRELSLAKQRIIKLERLIFAIYHEARSCNKLNIPIYCKVVGAEKESVRLAIEQTKQRICAYIKARADLNKVDLR